MNGLDDKLFNTAGFAYRDIIGQDKWETFTPVFTSLTAVGATTYAGRFRTVGKQCFFQVTILAATSLQATAGTTYMTLPITASGIAGVGILNDLTTLTGANVCVLDSVTSRLYPPSFGPTGDKLSLAGWYEI